MSSRKVYGLTTNSCCCFCCCCLLLQLLMMLLVLPSLLLLLLLRLFLLLSLMLLLLPLNPPPQRFRSLSPPSHCLPHTGTHMAINTQCCIFDAQIDRQTRTAKDGVRYVSPERRVSTLSHKTQNSLPFPAVKTQIDHLFPRPRPAHHPLYVRGHSYYRLARRVVTSRDNSLVNYLMHHRWQQLYGH